MIGSKHSRRAIKGRPNENSDVLRYQQESFSLDISYNFSSCSSKKSFGDNIVNALKAMYKNAYGFTKRKIY